MSRLTPLTTRSVSVMGVKLQNAVVYPTASSSSRNVSTKASRKKAEVKIQRKTSQSRANEFTLDMQPILNDALLRIEEVDPTYKDIISSKPTRSATGNKFIDGIDDPILREYVQDKENRAIFLEREKSNKIQKIIKSNLSAKEKIATLIKLDAPSTVILNVMHDQLPKVTPSAEHIPNLDSVDLHYAKQRDNDWYFNGHDVADSSDPDNLPQLRDFTPDEINRILQDVEETYFDTVDMDEQLFQPMHIAQSFYDAGMNDLVKSRFYRVYRDNPDMDILRYAPDEDAFMAETQDLGQTNLRRVLKVNEHAEVEKKLQARWRDGIRGEIEAKTAAEAALRAADDATLKQFAPMNLGDMPRMEALPLFFKMKKWDPMSPALQMTMARIQQDDALENKVLFPDEVRRNQREYMRSMGEIENKEFDMFNERPLGDFHYFINHHYNLMKKAYQKVTDEKHSLVRENRVKPDDVPAEEWKAAIKALSDDLLEFDHEKAAYYRYVRASKKDHHAEVMKRGFRDKRGFFKRKITDLGPGGEFTWEAPDDKAIKSPLGAAIEAVEKKIENKNNDEDVIPDDKKGKYFDDGIKYATPLSQDFDLSGLTRYLSRTSNDSAFKTGDITIPRYNIVDGVYVGLSNKITINAAGVQMENPKHSAIQCIILTLRNILAARGKNAIGGHDLTNAEYKFIRNIFETIPDHALTATLQKAVPSGTRAAQYADAIKSIMINSGVVYEAEDEEALRLAGADDYEEIMKHDLDKVQQAKKLSSGSTDGPVINGVSTSTGSLISNDLLSTLLADDVDEIGEGLAPKIVKEEVVTSEEDEKFVNYVNSDGEFHYAHVNDNAELVNTYRQLKTRAKAYDYKSFEEFDDDDTFLETMMAAESYEIFKELLRTGIDGDLKIPELEKYESRGERTFFFWRKFFADLAQQEHLFTAPRNNDTFLEWMGLTKDEAQEYSQKYYDKFTALVEKGRHEIAPVMTKDKKKWDDPLHYQRFMADLHPDIESLDWAEEIPETTAPDMNAGNVDMHRKKMESRFYPHIAEDIRDRDIWNIYFDERPAHISWTESYRVGYADFIRAELRTNIVHRRRLANPALRKNALHVVPLISKKNLRRYRKGLVKHAGIPEHLVEFMEYMYAPRPYLGEDPLTRRISRIQKDQALNYDPNEIRTLTESVDEIKYDAERTKKPIKSNYLTAKTDDHLNGGFDTDKELPDISKPIDFAGETTFDGHTYRIPGGGGGASADNSMPPVREFISTSAARPNFWEREYDLRWRFKTSDLHMSFGDQYGQYINTEGAVVGTYRKGQDFRMQFEETSEDFAGVWGFNDHLYHAIDNFENCRPSNMWTQRTDHQLSHFFHVTDYESKKRMEALRFEMGNLDGREKPILRPAQLAQQQQKQKAEFEVEGTTDSEKEREFMMSALAMPVSDLDRRIDSEIEKMVFEYNFDNQENLIPESDEDEAALFAEYTPEKVDDIKELPIDENALLDISSDVAEEHENQVNVEGENTKLAVFPNDITAHFYDHGFGKYVDSSIFLKIAADPIGDSFYSVEHIKSVKARQGDSLDSFAPSSKSVEDVDNTLDAVIGNPEPIANVQVQEFVKQHNQTTYAELHNLINMEAFKDYTRKVNSQLWSSHAEQFENPLSVYMDHYKKELLALVEDRFVKHPSYKYFNFEKIPLPEFVGGSNQGVRIKSNRKVSTVVDRIQHDFMTVKFNTDDPQLSYTKYKKIRSDFIQEVFDEFDKSLDENEQSVVAEFDAFAKMMGRGDTAEYIQSSTDDDNDFDYAYLSEPSVTISKKHKLFKDTVHTLTSGSASDSAPDLGEATASDVSDGESTANELELSTSEFEEVDLLSKAEYTPSPSPVEVESASEIEESEFEYEEFGEQRADIVYEANTPLPIYIMRDLINSTKNSKSPSSDVLSTNNTISSGLDHVAGDEGYTMVHDVINELYEISKLHSLLNHAQDVVTNATELVESDEEARLPRRRRLAADVADPEYSDIETDEIESNSDYEETDEAEEVTEVAEGEEGVVDEEVDVPEIKVRADEQARRFFSKHFDAERETSEMTSRLDTTFDVFFRAWVDAHVDEIMENLLKINTTYNDSKVADGVVVLGDKTGDSEYQGHALPNAAYDHVVGGHSRQYRKITKSEFAELHQQFLQYATAKQGVRIDYSRLDDLISSLSGVPNIDYNVIYKSIKTGQAHNIDENLILPEETVESGSDQENVQRVIGQIKLLRDSGIVNPTDYGPIFRSSSLLTPFFQTTPVEIPITRSPFYNADGTRKAFQFAPDQSHFSIGIQDVFTRFVNIKGRELLLNDDVHAKYLEFAQKAGFIPAEDPSYSTSELDEHEISLLKEDYKIIDPQDESLAHQDIELAEIYLSKVKIADHIVDSSFGVIAPKASVSPLYTKLMAFVKGLQRRRYADSQLKESNLDVVKFLVEAETLHHLMADYKERKNTFFDGLDLDLDIIAHHKHDPVPLPNPSDAKMTAITARMLYRSVESFAANHDEAAMYSLFNLVAVNGGTYYKRFNYAAQALTAIVRAHPYPRLFSRFCNLSDPVWERLDLVEKKAINIYDGVDSLESSNDYRMYTLTGAEDEFVDKKKKKVNLESESKDTVSTQFNVRVNDLDKQVEDSNVERVLRSIRNTKISQQHIPSADSISVMFERLITRDNTNAILDDLTNTTEALKSPHKILSAINFVSNTGDDRAISAILLAITHGNVEELDALVRLNMLNPILTSDLINYAIRSSIYAFLEEKTKYGTPMYEAALDTLVTLESERQRVLDIRKNNIEDRMSISQFNKLFSEGWNNENIADIVYKPVSFKSNLTAVQTAILEEAKTLRLQNAYDYNQIVKEYKNANVLTDSGRAILMKQGALAQLHSKLKEGNLLSPEVCVSKMLSDDSKVGPNDESTTLLTYGLPNVAGQYGILPLHTLKAIQAKIERNVREATVKTQVIAKTPQEQLDETKPEMLPYYGVEEPFSPETPAEQSHRIRAEKDIENWIQTFFTANDAMKFTLALDDIGKYGENDQFEWANEKKEFAHRNFDLEDYTRKMDMDDNEESEVVQVEKNIFDLQAEADKILETKELNILREKLVMNEQKRYDTHQWEEYEDYVYEKYPDMIDDGTMEFTPIKVDKSDIFEIFERKRWIHFNRNHRPLEEFNDEWMIDIYTKAELWIPGVEDRRIMRERAENSKETVHFDDPDNDGMTKEELAKFENIYTHKEHEQLLDLLRSRRHKTFISGVMSETDWWVNYHYNVQLEYRMQQHHPDESDADYHRVKSIHKQAKLEYVPRLRAERRFLRLLDDQDFYFFENDMDPNWYANDEMVHRMSRRLSPYALIPLSDAVLAPEISIDQQMNLYHLHRLDPATFNIRWIARQLNLPWNKAQILMRVVDMEYKNQVTRGDNYSDELMRNTVTNDLGDCLTTAQELIETLEGTSVDRFFSGSKPKEGSSYAPVVDQDLKITFPYERILHHGDREYDYRMFAPHNIGRVSWDPTYFGDPGWLDDFGGQLRYVNAGNVGFIYKTETMLARKWASKEQMLEAMDRAAFAKFGPLSWAARRGEQQRPPKLPREIIHPEVHAPTNANTMLTITDEKDRHIYSFMIRDRDGYLRHPTFREFRTIRTRLRDRRLSFYWRKFDIVAKLPEISSVYVEQLHKLVMHGADKTVDPEAYDPKDYQQYIVSEQQSNTTLSSH